MILSILLCCLLLVASAKDDSECEVCVSFLTKFETIVKERKITDQDAMKAELKKICKTAKNREERFCYYIGASPDSATTMLNDILKPMGFHKPPNKICAGLKQKNAQICDLKYEKQIDLKTVNINKMKVKELKKVLEDHGEDCKGCTEKSEFVKKVEVIAKSQGRTEF